VQFAHPTSPDLQLLLSPEPPQKTGAPPPPRTIAGNRDGASNRLSAGSKHQRPRPWLRLETAQLRRRRDPPVHVYWSGQARL